MPLHRTTRAPPVPQQQECPMYSVIMVSRMASCIPWKKDSCFSSTYDQCTFGAPLAIVIFSLSLTLLCCLLCTRPPMFLHRSTLHSIACGRGSGGSRYVDMNLMLDDETPLEFTNIHRDELVHLNNYIHSILIPAMKRDAIAQDNDDNDDDMESNTEEEEEEASLGKRKRTQRKASKEARQATRAHMEQTQDEEDSDDDDEGWEGGKGAEDEESDNDDDFGGEEAMVVDEDHHDDDDDKAEEEEELFEEQDSGTATESENDDE